MLKPVKKISVETAVKILAKHKFNVTKEETLAILDYLYELTEIAMNQLSREELPSNLR